MSNFSKKKTKKLFFEVYTVINFVKSSTKIISQLVSTQNLYQINSQKKKN